MVVLPRVATMRTRRRSESPHLFRRQSLDRSLRIESLESRRLLTSEFRNPVDPLDVDDNGSITAFDALLVINDIHRYGSGLLPAVRDPRRFPIDTNGDNKSSALDALVVINFIRRNKTQLGTLSDREFFDAQQTIDIPLGQTTGTRTYRLQVDANFGTPSSTSLIPDLFSVYLVDPAAPSQTLLDRGVSGTSLFSLSPRGSEIATGLARWDGSVLELDLSSLADSAMGRLQFQLLNGDSTSNSRVVVHPLTNAIDPEGIPGQRFALGSAPIVPTGTLDLSKLTEATTVQATVENLRFDKLTGLFIADVGVTNQGAAIGRDVALVLAGLPAGVTVENASGVDAKGTPYLNLRDAIRAGGLGTNELSQRVELKLNNPARSLFSLQPKVMVGKANGAPVLPAIPTQTVMPGGRIEIQLPATDPDNDRLTYTLTGDDLPQGSLQSGSGLLVFTPTPADLGTYQIKVSASDGALTTSRTFTLNVIADPIKTTRVSGRVLDVDQTPIVGIQVELGGVKGLTKADGSFQLEVGSGPLVTNTLKIRGETFVDPKQPKVVYPFIAEKLPLLMDHDMFSGANNMISRPIFLPKLDVANGKTIDPTKDTIVTTAAIPGASVFVNAGTLMNLQGTPFTGKLSITEVPVSLTPAALPPNLFPDLVVTIQPGDMVFTAPAPMTFPNGSGFAPGTLMDLWSINPVSGQFDDVGDMQVSADGSTVETISGGVRNSSWHFYSPTPNPLKPPKKDDPGCDNCEPQGPAKGVVSLNSGAITEDHQLATYQSLGETRGVLLHYDSLRADPREIIHFGYSDVDPNIFSVPDALKLVARLSVNLNGVEYVAPGFANPGQFGLIGGEHFWSIPAGSGPLDAAMQLDLRDQPTGVYPYQLMVGLRGFTGSRFIGSADISRDQLVHVNSLSSPFGSGWGIDGLMQLVVAANGSALIVDGGGTELLFKPNANVTGFVSPPGDFSTLVQLLDGTFRRTTKDQTVFQFDVQNRLSTMRDRHGNTTRYEYNVAGNLVKITDPAGLETTFAYTNGKATTITDPAGRVTQLAFDSAGNLMRITDSDGSTRSWEYNGDHNLTAETDKRGIRGQDFYDQFGRATRAIRFDGSVIQVAPGQVQGLYPSDQTIDPTNAPIAFRSASGDATYVDGNGQVIRTVLDAAGQEVTSTDAIGTLPTVKRNDQNLVTRSSDARGNLTDFTYDTQGNVLTISDAITAGLDGTLLADNFDTENGGQGVYDYTGFANWNVTRNGVDLLGNGLGTFYPNQGIYVDMAGTFGTSGRLESKKSFALTPGTYELSFLLGNTSAASFTTTNSLQVALGSAFDETFTVTGAVPLQAVTRTIVVTTSTQASLIFEHTDNESYGPVIDDVKLRRVEGGPAQPRRFTYDPAFNQLTSQTDDLGHQTLLDIDPANGNTRSSTQVIGAVGGPDDLVTQFTYTSQGLVNTETDPLGRITDYDYDARGRLVTVTLAKGTSNESKRQFVYDTAGNLTVAIDENGHRTDYAYDVLNRVTRITESDPDAGGPLTRNVTAFTYDPAGNLTTTTDARGNITRSEYDPLDRPSKTTDPNAGETGYRYDLAGNLTSVTDPLGHATRYRYDARNRLVETTDPDSGRTKFGYDADDNTTSVTDPVGNRTEFDYDTRSRLARETIQVEAPLYANDFEAAAGTEWSSNKTEVTPQGNRHFLGQFGPETTSLSIGTGSVILPGGLPTHDFVTVSFDLFMIRTMDGSNTQFGPDIWTLGVGDGGPTLLRTTFSNHPREQFGTSFDQAFPDQFTNPPTNHPARTSAVENDTLGYGTSFQGDSVYHLTFTFPHTASALRLDFTGGQDSPISNESWGLDNVQVSAVFDRQSRVFTYDAVDNLISLTDRNGRRTEYTYDDVDRRTGEIWVGGGNTITYAYDKASNLLSASDTFSRLAMTYDARDRVRTVDNAGTPGVPNVVLTYAYDPAGNRLSTADTIGGAAGGLNSYAYDGLDRVTRITQSGASVSNKRVDLAYNALGQFSSIQRFQDIAGTQLVIGSNYAYDALNRLTGLHHRNAANADVSFFDFTYDTHSRIIQITDVDGTTDYTYDNRDELTAANHADASNPDETYSYDANGNRRTSSRHGNAYVTGPNNRLLSDGTYNYTYNPEGNLLRRIEIATGKHRDFTWDYRNRLIAVSDKTAANVETQRVEFTYDVFNRRISKNVVTGGTTTLSEFVYDGADVLLDFRDPDGSGPQPSTLNSRLLHGPAVDQVFAQDAGDGNPLWLLTDQLGSTTDLVNNSGTVVNHVKYDSYGNVINQSDATKSSRYLYTGRELDLETGLYFYRARYYDAATGRFLSEDPIGFAGGQSNLYDYVGNLPIGRTDPTGWSGQTCRKPITSKDIDELLRRMREKDQLLDKFRPEWSTDEARRWLDSSDGRRYEELARLVDETLDDLSRRDDAEFAKLPLDIQGKLVDAFFGNRDVIDKLLSQPLTPLQLMIHPGLRR